MSLDEKLSNVFLLLQNHRQTHGVLRFPISDVFGAENVMKELHELEYLGFLKIEDTPYITGEDIILNENKF